MQGRSDKVGEERSRFGCIIQKTWTEKTDLSSIRIQCGYEGENDGVRAYGMLISWPRDPRNGVEYGVRPSLGGG